MVLLESELVSGGIIATSDNEGEKLKIPKLTTSKSDNQDTTNRIADLASQIAILQKNQEQLWKWLVEVGEKVGVAIAKY